MLNFWHSLLKLDNKPSQRRLPGSQGHRPFLSYVGQGQVEQDVVALFHSLRGRHFAQKFSRFFSPLALEIHELGTRLSQHVA